MKRISMQELISRLENAGYRISEGTIRNYLRVGLLPSPKKISGRGLGVRLIWDDFDEVMTRIQEIQRLRGKGYKLAEIVSLFENRVLMEAKNERRKYLARFRRMGKDVFFEIDADWLDRGSFQLGSSLAKFLDGEMYRELGFSPDTIPFATLKEGVIEVERRGLWKALYSLGANFVYRAVDDLFYASAWVRLRFEYDLEWSMLCQLFERGAQNLRRFFYLPEPDGVRFSVEFCRWVEKEQENCIGRDLWNFTEKIKAGFPLFQIPPHYRADGFGVSAEPECDSKYTNVNDFLADFAAGRCAFVPGFGPHCDGFFLRRLEGVND